MKQIYPFALLIATSALLVASTSLRASETDDRMTIAAPGVTN